MNYLGIDYGKSKIGLAKASDDAKVATPMRIISNDQNTIKTLEEIIEINSIDEIVIGYPLSLSGEAGPQAREVDAFIDELKDLEKPIHKQDERFSSKSAVAQKGDDDASAASLILQTYVETL